MKIIHGIDNISPDFKNCVVTIGVFDGVHLGHQYIIKILKEQSMALSVPSLIITFNFHPEEILSSKDEFFYLTTFNDKLNLFEQYGIDKCLIVKPDMPFFNISAEDFIKNVLYEKLGIKKIVVGENFVFGKNGAGNVELLKKTGKKYTFTVVPVSLKRMGLDIISSSFLRELLAKGKVEKVNKILNRNFSISGRCSEIEGFSDIENLFFYNFKANQLFFTKSGVYNIKIRDGKKISNGLLSVKLNEFIVGNDKLSFKDISMMNITTLEGLILSASDIIKIEILNFIRPKFKFQNKEQIIQKLHI